MDPDVRCPKKAVKLNHSFTWDFNQPSYIRKQFAIFRFTLFSSKPHKFSHIFLFETKHEKHETLHMPSNA